MLMELPKVRQIEDEAPRRWFYDPDVDLIVWHKKSDTLDGKDESDSILAFQFCYGKGIKEKAFTWHREKGFIHEAVSDGESEVFKYKQSPLLKQNGSYNLNKIIDLFNEKSKRIDKNVVTFVRENLNRSLEILSAA